MRRASVVVCGAIVFVGLGLAIDGAAFAAGSGPAVGAGPPAEVTSTTAVLVGAIDPSGQATTYAFQYGESTRYSEQTAVHIVDPAVTYTTVTAVLTGLRPGTTYHYDVIASNASGTNPGKDMTFKTAGLARRSASPAVAVTGPATAVGAHGAVLTGTLNPSGSNVRYYFQLGTRRPYELQTISQTLPAGLTRSVQAPISGLQANQVYHYRLVAVTRSGGVSAGSDRTFVTAPSGRLNPNALHIHVTPAFQRRLPDTVTVSGTLVPPRSLPRTAACTGFVDVAFRVHRVAIQLLRAGIHPDCRFRLRVRFSSRGRLHGGHVQVRVLFPGNEVLHRLAARRTVQIG
jgi:hypothetical protein